MILEREQGRERETLFCCSTQLCVHWLILRQPSMEPTALVYWHDALTNWATRPGPAGEIISSCLLLHSCNLIRMGMSKLNNERSKLSDCVTGQKKCPHWPEWIISHHLGLECLKKGKILGLIFWRIYTFTFLLCFWGWRGLIKTLSHKFKNNWYLTTLLVLLTS